MRSYTNFYINGEWVEPLTPALADVINPAYGVSAGQISFGTAADVDRAVKAARKAFVNFSQTTRQERLALFERIIAEFERRADDLAKATTEEMGAPEWLAKQAHVPIGLGHLKTAHRILQEFTFEEMQGTTRIVKEPIGVCAFITPWNWPLNQITCKVAPALATGCTMVLKPSEIAPFTGYIFAEIMEAARVPPGVFNLVNGDGPAVGAALSSHPGIDMVSFTGSTRAGIEVARNAAPTVKRVTQELGGKSANIILDDADFAVAVKSGVKDVMSNSGQTCTAPTRMFVPSAKMQSVIEIARTAAEGTTVGDPSGNAFMGPVVSQAQWDKIQGLIKKGIEEGATLVAGGPGKPEGSGNGYYVKPTVFANVTNDMTIAREEIFGPVLSILGYASEEQAIEDSNDTPYGLAAYVQGEPGHARKVAARLRAGRVTVNDAGLDLMAPFGGYKQSGNGREWGPYAFTEFLEIKAVIGYGIE